MPLSPAIIALFIVSITASIVFAYLLGFAINVVRRWDFSCSSELQLALEKKTQLAATLLSFIFFSELLSLLLFTYNAESLSSQFVGAMCATGVLNVNAWGWPTLFLKILIFFMGAIWLMVDHFDNNARDYPLTQTKYWLLLLITPVVFAETISQFLFFTNMNPDIITSCCGALFSAEEDSVAGEISGAPTALSTKAFVATGIGVILVAVASLRWPHLGILLGLTATVALLTALSGIVSFVSVYVYEHPHHHCPFCLLKSGHHYSGYFLYISLFIATSLALGSSVISHYHKHPSLHEEIKSKLPMVILSSLIFYVLFYGTTGWFVFQSNLKLENAW